jgi:zinc transport system substrate-binding protein
MTRSFRRSGALFRTGILAFTSLFILASAGCGSKSDDGWPKDKTGPKVAVSFAPYYCFAVNVAGDDAVVRTMMTTSGPHHFQPTDKDAHLLRKADLFFINGLGLDEDQAENLKKGSSNTKLKIIELGEKIPEDKLLAGVCHHHHKDGDHDHGKDAHVWLSPDYAITLVEGIRDELKTFDAPHAANYDRRAKAYIEKLQKLKEDGLAMLKDKKDRNMVTFHESLTYFAKTFDLNIVSVVEKDPGTEPNGKQLEELIALCADKDHPIRLITVEPQYSTSNSGASLIKTLEHKKVPDPVLVEIDTLETVVPEQLTADWYENKMRANLKALAEKMK